MQVNIQEAKTHFSQLVEKALAGEEVIIARNGRALLALTPIKPLSGLRTPGLSKGKGEVASDFDAPLEPNWRTRGNWRTFLRSTRIHSIAY
jgi:prevent-host-death family protein